MWTGRIVGALVALLLVEAVLWASALAFPQLRYGLSSPWSRGTVVDATLGYRPSRYAPGHDARGFRNPTALDSCDILAVGDSMTYGYAARAEDNWPSQLERLSGRCVYNMSYGGYGPVEYQALVKDGLTLRPRLVIVSLFVGNDLSEAYRSVWQSARFPDLKTGDPAARTAIEEADRRGTLHELGLELRPDLAPSRTRGVRPWLAQRSSVYGAGREMYRLVAGQRDAATHLRLVAVGSDTYAAAVTRPHRFGFDAEPRVRTVFLRPEYLALGMDTTDPRIREGLGITERALLRIQESTRGQGSRLIVLLIPGKHIVYEPLIRSLQAPVPKAFFDLLDVERHVTASVRRFLDDHGLDYHDVTTALREALAGGRPPYPEWDDEHPNATGYRAIAESLLPLISIPHDRARAP